jgi:hypothetical protein
LFLRLNLIIAIGYSFYTVLATCAGCSALRPTPALKTTIVPLVQFIAQDTLSFRTAAGTNMAPYCMLFPRFEQALFVIVQQCQLWRDILPLKGYFPLASLGYGIDKRSNPLREELPLLYGVLSLVIHGSAGIRSLSCPMHQGKGPWQCLIRGDRHLGTRHRARLPCARGVHPPSCPSMPLPPSP